MASLLVFPQASPFCTVTLIFLWQLKTKTGNKFLNRLFKERLTFFFFKAGTIVLKLRLSVDRVGLVSENDAKKNPRRQHRMKYLKNTMKLI